MNRNKVSRIAAAAREFFIAQRRCVDEDDGGAITNRECRSVFEYLLNHLGDPQQGPLNSMDCVMLMQFALSLYDICEMTAGSATVLFADDPQLEEKLRMFFGQPGLAATPAANFDEPVTDDERKAVDEAFKNLWHTHIERPNKQGSQGGE